VARRVVSHGPNETLDDNVARAVLEWLLSSEWLDTHSVTGGCTVYLYIYIYIYSISPGYSTNTYLYLKPRVRLLGG